MDLDTLWPFQLTRGHSKDPSKGACLLDAVSWFEDGCLNDKPACVSPVLARIGHFANDILPDDERQQLRRFIPRLVGTVDEEADRRRVDYLLFVCQQFSEQWDGSSSGIGLNGRWYFWDNTAESAKRFFDPLLWRTGILLERLGHAAIHGRGKRIWTDSMPVWNFRYDPGSPVPTEPVYKITVRQDVERIAIDLLDVCCAIGAPQADWDFSRLPDAVERFRRARSDHDSGLTVSS